MNINIHRPNSDQLTAYMLGTQRGCEHSLV